MPATKGKIKYTEQEILNNSFNENTALIETQIYGQDTVNNGARKIAVNPEGQIEVDIKTIPEVSIDKTGLATEEKQLPDNHNVTVSNQIPPVETGLAKETTAVTNAVTQSEEAILLRRLVKLLESNAVVDISGRQRVAVENLISTSLGRSIPGLDSGAGVASPNQPCIATAPVAASSTTYWQPVWIGPVDQRFQIIDAARLTYNQCIRSHLIFS